MGASPDLYSKDHSGSRFCSCWETCTRLDVCVFFGEYIVALVLVAETYDVR